MKYIEMLHPRQSKASQLSFMAKLLQEMPDSIQLNVDDYGNTFVYVGESSVAFTAHLDNVNRGKTTPHLKMTDNFVMLSEEDTHSSCIGADDASGVYIMLHMINSGVQGLYCFFLDEEVGCLGSKWSVSNEPDRYSGIKHMVSFDRMGYNSIITHQMGTQTCSVDFANALRDEIYIVSGLVFQLDDGGVYTDSNSFDELIPNCTNLSVGYFNQHSRQEKQDLVFLKRIADTYSKVDWESLPVGTIPPASKHNWMSPDYYESDTNDNILDETLRCLEDYDGFYEALDALIQEWDVNQGAYEMSSDPFYYRDSY